MESNVSTSKLWDTIYQKFNSKICKQCFTQTASKHGISHPQPIPFVGSEFAKTRFKLMFIGIETWNNNPRYSLETSYDEGEFGFYRTRELFNRADKGGKGQFWNWVRDISKCVFENDDLDYLLPRIAYSNLHKCQVLAKKNVTSKDFDTFKYYLHENSFKNCIQEARWVHKEINELNPKNIIIFAGRKNNGIISKMISKSLFGKKIQLTYFDYSSYDLDDSDQMKRKDRDIFIHRKHGDKRYIITNHPQYTPNEIKCEIIDIIKNNK